jgi:hypothetical protein
MSKGKQYSAASHKTSLFNSFTIQLRDDGERRSQTLATVIGEQRYTSDYGVARAVLLYF